MDRKGLQEVLARLQERVAGCRRAAVIVPTAWVRTHLMDFDELPRRSLELDDVVRWRLKKLLPVLPSELRVSVVAGRAAGRGRP